MVDSATAPLFHPKDISSFNPSTPFAPPSPRGSPFSFSPPPDDIDEEPSDFEDDIRAMMDIEANESLQRDVSSLGHGDKIKVGTGAERTGRREIILTPPPSIPHRAFVPDLSFDKDESVVPVASTSRLSLTPPPEVQAPIILIDERGHVLRPLTAETASGKLVRFKRRLRPRAPVDMAHARATERFDLLATPLHVLLQEVDELKSHQKALELQTMFETEQRPKGKAPATTMWVDKYRPKKFSDLLGEDRVHRDVMTWLKEWDKCVFKRVGQNKKRKAEEEGFVFDPLGRPRDRILLLSGPPGYGKTTLAHVVARHAGYRTLEINASDDRSAATVSTRIKNAIDAGAALGSEGRPTCVIIDEIDGASGGGDASFVRSLIKLIQDVPARKKTNTAAKPLRRPIICICNDLYAPSLRPLRPFARVVRFRKPPSQFLVARLRDICEREQLTADLRVLTTLADVTSGDVRSCLNTLQFIKSKSSVVTDEAIKSSAVGSKDTGMTLQTVWNSLLVPMAAKQRRKALGIDDGRYVDRLAFAVQACGEYDRLVQGCFEHYPNLKPLDASLSNVCKLHDWIAYYDRISGRISETMDFEMLAYVPYAIVPWYSHFAAPANATRPAEWPKADYESYQTRLANEEIVTSLKATIPPVLRSLFSSSTTLTELIPLLMRVISPPLKPVNANIVKPAERAVLARLVDLMIPLGLRFWLEKTEDGQPMMRLDPAIDVFVHYEGKRAGDIATSRFAVRQLIAQTMDSEMARRRGQAGANGDHVTTAESLAEQYGVAKTGRKDAKAAPATVIATDFFGRVKTVIVADEASINPTDAAGSAVLTETADCAAHVAPKRFRALYRFNEGSSSAVRKNVKMSEFF